MKLKKILTISVVAVATASTVLTTGCQKQKTGLSSDNAASRLEQTEEIKTEQITDATVQSIISTSDKTYANASSVEVSYNWTTRLKGDVEANDKTNNAEIEWSMSFDLGYDNKTGSFSSVAINDKTVNDTRNTLGISYYLDKISKSDKTSTLYGGLYDNDESPRWSRMAVSESDYDGLVNYVVAPLDGMSIAEDNIDKLELVGTSKFKTLDCYVMKGKISASYYTGLFGKTTLPQLLELANKDISNVDIDTTMYFDKKTCALVGITMDTTDMFTSSQNVANVNVEKSKINYIFTINGLDKVQIPEEARNASGAEGSQKVPGAEESHRTPSLTGAVFGGRLSE